jgi:hypothetical protein
MSNWEALLDPEDLADKPNGAQIVVFLLAVCFIVWVISLATGHSIEGILAWSMNGRVWAILIGFVLLLLGVIK